MTDTPTSWNDADVAKLYVLAKQEVGRRQGRGLDRHTEFDDLVQECVIACLEEDVNSTNAHLVQCMRMRLAKLFEKANRREGLVQSDSLTSLEDDPSFDIEDPASSAAFSQIDELHDLLLEVETPTQKEFLELMLKHGADIELVAEELDISKNAAVNRLSRLRRSFGLASSA